jgi:hypothetical protein
MSILAQILNRKNRGTIPVATPEWDDLDGTLGVRRLSPRDRTAFYELAATEKPEAGIQFLALVTVYCTVHREPTPSQGTGCPAEGAQPRRAFADGDWRTLSVDAGSGSAVERLAEIADEANVLSDRMRETLKKKYETTPDSASNSGSPAKAE